MSIYLQNIYIDNFIHFHSLKIPNKKSSKISATICYLIEKLMRPHDLRQPIMPQKLVSNILPENEPRPTRRFRPTRHFLRIRPKQIAHWTRVRHLLDPIKRVDVLQRVQFRGQPPVQAENTVVNYGREGQVVEQIGDILPHVQIPEFTNAFVVEAIRLRFRVIEISNIYIYINMEL